MTRVSIHSVELTPLECEVLSELMAAKLEQHLADRAKYVRKDVGRADLIRPRENEALATSSPQKPALLCADCAWLRADGDGPCATHRRACEGCGRGPDDVALHDGDASTSKLGPGEAPIVERWCNSCDPVGSLDRAQLAALRAFRSGLPAREYPLVVFRRLFDLERLGMVEKQGDAYWITDAGLAALGKQ